MVHTYAVLALTGPTSLELRTHMIILLVPALCATFTMILDTAVAIGVSHHNCKFACFVDNQGGSLNIVLHREVFPPPQHRHSGNWISRAGLASIASTTYFSGGHGKRGGLPRRGGY
ncbi:hypothetical protein BGZ60DRAFT_412974 [Tricladium varicosporioides]|nr:hypothetical protein BGZ60DRAFT_412974 [Hymenoscyphus varicosporioides]